MCVLIFLLYFPAFLLCVQYLSSVKLVELIFVVPAMAEQRYSTTLSSFEWKAQRSGRATAARRIKFRAPATHWRNNSKRTRSTSLESPLKTRPVSGLIPIYRSVSRRWSVSLLTCIKIRPNLYAISDDQGCDFSGWLTPAFNGSPSLWSPDKQLVGGSIISDGHVRACFITVSAYFLLKIWDAPDR